MYNLCNYKNIFGKVKEGVHSYRIFDIAAIDVFFTILLSYIISIYSKYNIIIIIIILFVLSIFIHKLFCVETTIANLF